MAVIRLGATLPRRSSHLPADSASSVIVRLLGVAPDGGCRVSPASPRCYPWPSDSSLWPCSSRSSSLALNVLSRLGVTQHPALWSPDFPLPAAVGTAVGSDGLADFESQCYHYGLLHDI